MSTLVTPESPDIAVIGAGVFGLSVALAACRAGLSVRLIEARHPGAGSSGGPVGALAPHGQGKGWLPAFQHEALTGLPDYATALRDLSGRDPGYARTGRLAALTDQRAVERAREDAAALNNRWGPGSAEVRTAPGGTFDSVTAVLADRVTARLTPALWLDAHVAALARLGVTPEIATARSVDPSGAVATDRGRISAGHVVIAAGWAGAPLLAPHGMTLRGMKGQAAWMEPVLPPSSAVLTAPGLYVVAHKGHVGVGSTAENVWEDQHPDGMLEEVIARARVLVPALRDARVTARWAAIRPRGPGSGPLAGPLPGAPRIIAATGGHRIGFALAHRIAEGLIARVIGKGRSLPVECLPVNT